MRASVKRIVAAGTVTMRHSADGIPEVLLVHRPRYDDWSLPKGKLNNGEYLPACATRETEEETAVSVRLGLPVAELTYPVGGGTKTVSYWQGNPAVSQPHEVGAEVDQIAWLSVTQALRQLSYPDERELIHRAVNLPPATPLLIVRHAKALPRGDWAKHKPDHKRPLDARGHAQSESLVELLGAYGVSRLGSSAATRCHQTLKPLAKTCDLSVEKHESLTEEVGLDPPTAVTKLIKSLAVQTAAGTATAVCGHRPVLPTMLAALGLPDQSFRTAEALVVHLGADATVHAVEMHSSPL